MLILLTCSIGRNQLVFGTVFTLYIDNMLCIRSYLLCFIKQKQSYC